MLTEKVPLAKLMLASVKPVSLSLTPPPPHTHQILNFHAQFDTVRRNRALLILLYCTILGEENG
jgi:hypothetical protein